LKYVSKPALRFGVRAAMTKIEAFQDFSGWVFFGGDKIIKSRDPIEYEKRIKYKDLIANAIMLHNVVDMTDVLHDMRQEGYEVTSEFASSNRFCCFAISETILAKPDQESSQYVSKKV